MAQVTIYLDAPTAAKMKAAAKAAGTSHSQWIASLIREKTATEWPRAVARRAGAWRDDFPTLEEIRQATPETPSREPL